MKPLALDNTNLRYQGLIGTGGVGSGLFFALDGDHTLGREESRSGRFLDRRDYCKLHIVAHYVKAIMGMKFPVFPIAMVGQDQPGSQLLQEIRQVGLETKYIKVDEDQPTLYCICFIYPNGDGGNLTVDDSASSRLGPDYIRHAQPDLASLGQRGIALALPEVPLDARQELLNLATTHGLFRAAAFTSAELAQSAAKDMLAMVDLLALNADEAAILAELPADTPPDQLVSAAVEKLRRIQPQAMLSVTAGAKGSWTCHGQSIHHCRIPQAPVVSTAGAGDALFAGLLCGLAANLSLPHAHQLGALVAALAVTSPHTINKDIDRPALCRFAHTQQITLPDALSKFLKPPS